jgi:hypothetical protein
MTNPTPLLAALQDGVALNPGMVEASGDHRWREALACMMEMASQNETEFKAINSTFGWMAELIEKLRQENTDTKARLAALEAWQQAQREDGK